MIILFVVDNLTYEYWFLKLTYINEVFRDYYFKSWGLTIPCKVPQKEKKNQLRDNDHLSSNYMLDFIGRPNGQGWGGYDKKRIALLIKKIRMKRNTWRSSHNTTPPSHQHTHTQKKKEKRRGKKPKLITYSSLSFVVMKYK